MRLISIEVFTCILKSRLAVGTAVLGDALLAVIKFDLRSHQVALTCESSQINCSFTDETRLVRVHKEAALGENVRVKVIVRDLVEDGALRA